jgi:hypothetical protein
MLPGNLVCGFVRISGRHEPRVFLIIVATLAGIDFVYVQGSHDAFSTITSGGREQEKQ